MRPVIAVAVALFTLIGLGACGPNASSTRPVHCSITGDPPERDSLTAPKRIVASVRFWCDDPGSDKLTLTVRLQKQNSKGTWVDQTKRTFTGKRGQTTRPEEERYHVWSVSIPCAEGNFRTVVGGSYTSRKVTRTYKSIGVRSNDPCQPTIFS